MQINAFIDTISGLSPHTIRAYKNSLWLLYTHMKAMGDDVGPDIEPNERHILSFLSKYSGNSMHRHKAAVKDYLEFLGQPWPFSRRQFRFPKRRIPRYTSPENIPLLLENTTDEDDAMFIETLFQLGCRISELMGIEEKDIIPAGVLVIGKGGDQQLKLTTKEFNAKLKRYARKHGSGKIFPKKYRYYLRHLKSIGEKAGIMGLSLHMLRHARALDLLNKGLNLSYVQQFLGHADISTTAIYTQITGGELAPQLERVDSNGTKGETVARRN